MSFVLCTLHLYYMYRLLNYISIEQWGLVWVFIILLAKVSTLRKKVELHLHLFNTKLYPLQNLSLGFILKIFLKFRKFQPRYSYKIYSYRKKECMLPINHSLPIFFLSLLFNVKRGVFKGGDS